MEAITQLLLAAQNPDRATREAAELQLTQLQNTNAPLYLRALSRELADETKPQQSRSLAGITLKNTLTSRDDAQAEKLARDWRQLDDGVRREIKDASTAALSSSVKDVRNTAAQVVSKIATIELPKNMWPELMPALIGFVAQADASPAGQAKKEATLACIGYICEEIAVLETDVLETQSSAILTAVVAGMRKEEPSVAIKHVAAKALLNALEFVKRNFEVDNERNYIMQVTCDACHQSVDPRVKEVAFECLVRIAELYYDKLSAYMQALFELTVEAIRSESDPIARQAIEFWSTICDREYDLEQPHYIKGALQHLMPLFLETMTKHESDPDDEEDEDNKATRASTCVGLIANTVTDDMVPYVTSWASQHLINPDWHYRESAVLALGYMLEGPSDKTLMQSVTPFLATLVGYLKDPTRKVRDSTAWTLGRICQFCPVVIAPAQISSLLDTFISCMAPEINTPKTARHICWAIHNLAENVVEKTSEAEKPPQRNDLTERLPNVCQALLACAGRPDARSESNLRASAIEALCTVIKSAAPDSLDWLYTQLLNELGRQLTLWINKTQFVNQDDVNERNEWLSLLCGALQDVISQLDHTRVVAVADTLMQCFCQVLTGTHATAHEEALLAIGSVCTVLGRDFEKYAGTVCQTFVVPFLGNWREVDVCGMAIHLVGDMCRGMEEQFCSVAESVMAALVDVVANPEVDASIIGTNTFLKPSCYEVFGDIALAITANFNRYLPTVANFLLQGSMHYDASLKAIEANPDDDQRYYLDRLCESILQAYTGIIQGFKLANEKQPEFASVFLPYVDNLMKLLGVIANDEGRDDDVTKAAAGVIGDLAFTFGGKIKPQLHSEYVSKIIQSCMNADKSEHQTIGQWANEMIQKAR